MENIQGKNRPRKKPPINHQTRWDFLFFFGQRVSQYHITGRKCHSAAATSAAATSAAGVDSSTVTARGKAGGWNVMNHFGVCEIHAGEKTTTKNSEKQREASERERQFE